MNLGERIAQLRRQAGLSQEQLGDLLGVSRQAVSKWESGQTSPDLQYVLALCQQFQVTSDWLLTGQEAQLPRGEDAPSARCPDCGGEVGQGVKYCPNCGRALQGWDRYTLLLVSHNTFSWAVTSDIQELSRLPYARGGALDGQALDQHQAEQITLRAPVVLCRGLSLEEARQGALLFRGTDDAVQVFPDRAGRTARELLNSGRGLTLAALGADRAPMTFGKTVLAVVLGVAGALLLLSIL